MSQNFTKLIIYQKAKILAQLELKSNFKIQIKVNKKVIPFGLMRFERFLLRISFHFFKIEN